MFLWLASARMRGVLSEHSAWDECNIYKHRNVNMILKKPKITDTHTHNQYTHTHTLK